MITKPHPILSLTLLLSCLAGPLLAADRPLVNLQPASDITTLGPEWAVPAAQQPLVTLERDEGGEFLRLAATTPTKVLLRRKLPLPEGATTVTFHYQVRVSAVTKGANSHHLPRLALQWDNDPKFTHERLVSFPAVTDGWKSETLTVPVPAGAKEIRFNGGLLECAGVMDLRKLRIAIP